MASTEILYKEAKNRRIFAQAVLVLRASRFEGGQYFFRFTPHSMELEQYKKSKYKNITLPARVTFLDQ